MKYTYIDCEQAGPAKYLDNSVADPVLALVELDRESPLGNVKEQLLEEGESTRLILVLLRDVEGRKAVRFAALLNHCVLAQTLVLMAQPVERDVVRVVVTASAVGLL